MTTMRSVLLKDRHEHVLEAAAKCIYTLQILFILSLTFFTPPPIIALSPPSPSRSFHLSSLLISSIWEASFGSLHCYG